RTIVYDRGELHLPKASEREEHSRMVGCNAGPIQVSSKSDTQGDTLLQAATLRRHTALLLPNHLGSRCATRLLPLSITARLEESGVGPKLAAQLLELLGETGG